MSKILFPDPPLTPGQSFDAPNGVTYTWDATIGTGVWVAAATAPVAPLTITNPGTITGTAEVGATLSYATGTATGGVGAIGYTWQWFITPSTPLGAASAPSVTVPAGALGQNIYVTLTATDSATPTPASATANTANYPTPPNVIQPKGITNAVVPTTIPGTATFAWADGSQSLTATGCIEFSVDAGLTWQQGPQAVTNSTTVLTRWEDQTAGVCGQAANGTSITGTLTDGTNTSTFNFTIDRLCGAFTMSPNTETTTPSTLTTADPSFTLTGGNTAPLVWGTLTGGGSTPEFSTDGGTTWVALPSAPTPGVSVPQNVATIVRFTTSGSVGTETLDVFAGASTTAGQYQSSLFTVTVASSVFPNTTFSPGGAPNASPASVSASPLFGKASATWGAGTTNLTSTGGLQFQVNGGGYGTSYTGINDTDTIDLIWDPSAISTAADNATLTGTLTNGVYTNTFTITVTRGPVTGFSFTDTTGNALSTATTSGIITPAGFNVPVALTYAGTTTNPLTSIGVAVGTGGFLGSPQTVNPGQTLQIQGTTGGTASTAYGVNLTMGSGPAATDTWTAETVSSLPTITPPTIQTPSGGSTGQGSATGIQITASTYNNLNGAGTPQTSSDWEVYKNAYPITSTGTISTVTPGTAGTPSLVKYKLVASSDPPAATAQNSVYGKLATDAFNDVSHPLFQWVKTLSINGYTDWYIPAKNELEILYFNLKPNTTANVTSSGINLNAVPARASNYTAGNPAQTTNALFAGGAQAFSLSIYWSSTQSSSSTGFAWTQNFIDGSQPINDKDAPRPARAVRRIPISEYTAAGSPAIGTYLKGGYYGGQISTAGNSTADYALIVAPNPQGTYNYTGGTNASLTIAGADTNGFQVGMQIKGSTSGAVGIILSINSTTIQYLPVSGTFQTSETIITDPASYSQITGSPFNKTTGTLTSLDIAKPPLEANTKYWVRAKYTTTNLTATTSAFGNWSDFTTGSLIPATGALYGGGYFAGQIVGSGSTSGVGGLDNSGTIYNLVVAPVEGNTTGPVTGGSLQGQNGGATATTILYRTTAAANGNTNAQNLNFGGLCTSEVLAGSATGGAAAYPVFNTFINGATGPNAGLFNLATGGAGGGTGIGGYNDWYLPAKNELAVLYFFLKPDSTTNTTGSGSNPQSVTPYTPNTNYGVGFPDPNNTPAFFKTAGGTQAFVAASNYWSSSEDSSITTSAWTQTFVTGGQNANSKTTSRYARAIRRVLA